jgi:hypothetical protein
LKKTTTGTFSSEEHKINDIYEYSINATAKFSEDILSIRSKNLKNNVTILTLSQI